MSWKQRRKKNQKDFTVIVDEDSAVMSPKNRNLANPMITFRTQSNPDPSITINMPRKWKFHGNVPQRPKDVSISFDKRIEFGQAGPSTEKIVIENDVPVEEQKPRNRLFEALGVKKPIVINQDLVRPAFVSKIHFTNPFLVAKEREEIKKKQAEAALTETRIKRSAINPILPPGIDTPVAQKRTGRTVITTVRAPAPQRTLTVIRSPAKIAKEQSSGSIQQPSSATVDTTTSSYTAETEEMLRIFPKKQTYDPEKMTTSDKEKMQKEIFATRKRKFEQNSKMNPSVLPPHLLQPIKRKTVETPSTTVKSDEKTLRRGEESCKESLEKEEKHTISVRKIEQPKTSPPKENQKDRSGSFLREHKQERTDSHRRKSDTREDKNNQKVSVPTKSSEKDLKSYHHEGEHGRDSRKSDGDSVRMWQRNRHRGDSRDRASSKRLSENEPVGRELMRDRDLKREEPSHHRSHHRKPERDSSPLLTSNKNETKLIRLETENDSNRRCRSSSHHKSHDNNQRESEIKKSTSSTASLMENDSILIRQVTKNDLERADRHSSSRRKYSEDESKRNSSPKTSLIEKGCISIRHVTEEGSSEPDRDSSHRRRHKTCEEDDSSERKESAVLMTKEKESTFIELREERGEESKKRRNDHSPRRDREYNKRKREDDRKISSYARPDKKLRLERNTSRKDEKHVARGSTDFNKDEYKSEFESPKVLDATNGRDRIIPFFTNKYIFSNHFACAGLKINEKNFCCTEQYYMWRKAKFSKNEAAAAAILMSTDAKQMKLIGSSLDKFDARSWKKVSWKYMLEANLQKYEQFEKLRFELFRTIGGVLVEASPKDDWWGVGLDLDSKDLKDWRKWRGKNLFGELLMEIRDRLSREYKYKDEVQRARRCLLVDEQQH